MKYWIFTIDGSIFKHFYTFFNLRETKTVRSEFIVYLLLSNTPEEIEAKSQLNYFVSIYSRNILTRIYAWRLNV